MVEDNTQALKHQLEMAEDLVMEPVKHQQTTDIVQVVVEVVGMVEVLINLIHLQIMLITAEVVQDL